MLRTPWHNASLSAVLSQLLTYRALACRFIDFIYSLDEVGNVDEHDAAEENQLSEEQIQNIATQFGQQVDDARDLFKLRRQMSVDEFRDWVNAAGYLQMLQHALAYGTFNKTGSLW